LDLSDLDGLAYRLLNLELLAHRLLDLNGLAYRLLNLDGLLNLDLMAHRLLDLNRLANGLLDLNGNGLHTLHRSAGLHGNWNATATTIPTIAPIPTAGRAASLRRLTRAH